MRIISYNILDGGEGRADPLAEVILAQRPDVVALVEADDLDVLHRLGKRLGMDWVHAPASEHAAALFTRFDIVHSINHAALHPDGPRSLLEAVLRDPGGAEWTIGVLHLSAKAAEQREQVRERELAVALRLFEPHRRENRPHLLVGDFNANSPVQQIDLARCKPATRKAYEANGGTLPRRVVQAMLDAGYLDTLHAVDPQRAATLASFTTKDPGQRVDYIFAYGLADRIRDAWIEQDRLAQFASDHYPVGAEISEESGVRNRESGTRPVTG